MSKYTSEVRFICENYAGLTESVGYASTNNVIATARSKVFDFDYPIFDEKYRPVLETKILKHFYTREIGAESVGLWKLWLDARLNEIMPYYNKLYNSELIEFNPMYDVDLTRDYKKDNEGIGSEHGDFNESSEHSDTSTTNGNGSGNVDNNSTTSETGGNKIDRWEYFSDTPQGGINGIASLEYLTNAKHITDDGSQSLKNSNIDGTSESNYNEHSEVNSSGDNSRSGSNNKSNSMNSTEDYLEHVKGKTAGVSYSKRLEEYRQTFLNIDMQVINELNDLFMNLW